MITASITRHETLEWMDVLSRLVISGRSPEAAAAIVATSMGADATEARAFAANVATSTLAPIAREYWVRLQCREWLLRVYSQLAAAWHQANTVDHADDISRDAFRERYYFTNTPLFFTGIAKTWPAVSLWDQSYLISACGDELVEIMEGRTAAAVADQNTAAALRTELLFSEYVRRVFEGPPTNDYYMVSRNRFFERAGARRLLSDLRPLSFVDTSGRDGDKVRMWFGPSGTVTPLHYDDKNNVIVQVRGTKTVRLYAPYFSEFMQQTQPWYARTDPKDVEQLSGAAGPSEIVVTLRPGDGLFIPVGWWHAITATDVSITLAFTGFGVANDYERP